MNIIYLNCGKYELDRKKIITVIDTTFAVVKRKPEKNSFLQRNLLFFAVVVAHLPRGFLAGSFSSGLSLSFAAGITGKISAVTSENMANVFFFIQ